MRQLVYCVFLVKYQVPLVQKYYVQDCSFSTLPHTDNVELYSHTAIKALENRRILR